MVSNSWRANNGNELLHNLRRWLIARDPNCWGSLQGLGIARLNQGSLGKAETAFTEAAEIVPDQAEAHGYRGMALLALARWEEAAEAYERSIELAPDTFASHEAHAKAVYELGRWDDAIAACRRAIELKPDVASVHFRLGQACLKRVRLSDAVEAFRGAIEVAPEMVDCYEFLGRALVTLGQKQEAIDLVRQASEQVPNAKSRLGALRAELGIFDGQEIGAVDWYHTIDLGAGIVTPGMFDHRGTLDLYRLPDRMDGLRVLDVATWDGFWGRP